jgi:signal transduction histidine kinase/ActR/RegA family two-component response regulator
MNDSGGNLQEKGLMLKPLLFIAILACFSIGGFLLVSQHYINSLFSRVENQYRQAIINVTSVARNSVEPVLARLRSGGIDRREAVRLIRSIARNMTYEDQDGRNYVFMSSYDGTMLVQPFEPHKELTNQWDLRDANGLYIIRELVRAARANPSGSFVRYYYYLPKVHTVQEKMAYVVGLPEIECYIGTGMYMKRAIEEQREILVRIKYASVLLLVAVLIPVSVSVFFLLNRNRQLAAEMRTRRKAEEDRLKLELRISHSQKMDAIGQLAGGVAHDFNNLLAGIQGNTSLMLMGCGHSHPHYSRLMRIEEMVKRGSNLTRQLLGFAREGKYEIRTVSVKDLLAGTARFFTETRKEITADFDFTEDTGSVEADPGQLEQVFLNIFINAGHAMPGGGRINIRTENITLRVREANAFDVKAGDYVKISITDTGTGIDEKTLPRIFEPFFTTKSEEGGSGLGLASAYGIIRNHGGAISASSIPGQGSTFTIYLPLSGKSPDREHASLNDSSLIRGSGGILLLDDEPEVIAAAAALLQMLGYTVYGAQTADEAISLYRDNMDRIDLVILDMILRGTNGAAVLKTLKEINPGIKVILSSGYGLQGEVRKVMESGCAGFIQKPYDFADMSAIVHRVLNPFPGQGNQDPN